MPSNVKSTGPKYLTQCACFACRKAFKKDLADPRYHPKCPECGTPMHDMGRYFRAPRHGDTRQWRKVELLFRAGVYFRDHDFGPLPKTVSEATRFIAANRTALAANARRRALWESHAVAEIEATEEKRRLARQALKRKRNQRDKATAQPK